MEKENKKQGCGKEGISPEGEIHLVCGEGILCDECSAKIENKK